MAFFILDQLKVQIWETQVDETSPALTWEIFHPPRFYFYPGADLFRYHLSIISSKMKKTPLEIIGG